MIVKISRKMATVPIHTGEISSEWPPDAAKKPNAKDGAFIFAAYGCALLERQTPSGMYVYTAANYETGKTEFLCRRKKQLDSGGFEDMAAKVCKCAVRGASRLDSDKNPGESVPANIASSTAREIFNEILPKYGYNLREKQVELTEHILDVVGRRGITLAESEVGTGKTHAYLVAAALAKRGRLNDFWLRGSGLHDDKKRNKRQSWADSAHMPVVISTSSIALQKAIVTDYIPELSRILVDHGVIKEPLTAVIRKGKEHFICEQRLSYYITVAEPAVKKRLEGFVGTSAPYDLTNADGLSPYIKRQICVTGHCEDNCPRLCKCRYKEYLKRANDPGVDFQITNHNYFIADTLHRNRGKRPLLPNYQLVIIDEAHKFLAAAQSMYGMELTEKEIPALVNSVHRLDIDKSRSGINIHKLAQKLEGQSKRLFRHLNECIPAESNDDETERFTAVIDVDNMRHLRNITAITGELSDALSDSNVKKRYADLIPTTMRRLANMGERAAALKQQERLIYWLEKPDSRISNKREPNAPTANEPEALCAIPKDLDLRLYRDLWSKGIPIVLTSGTLSAGGDFTRIKETLGLNHLPPRQLFSVTKPSPFDYKRNLLVYIAEDMPFPNGKDKNYIAAVANRVEQLVTASHGHAAVLFTSYNAMGQVHALLAKRNIPFPLFKQVMAKQGGGRVLRTEKDTGGLAFLDCRCSEAGKYRGKILELYPDCEVTSEIARVGEHFRDIKPPSYFAANSVQCNAVEF